MRFDMMSVNSSLIGALQGNARGDIVLVLFTVIRLESQAKTTQIMKAP